jgi:hypothetical protein
MESGGWESRCDELKKRDVDDVLVYAYAWRKILAFEISAAISRKDGGEAICLVRNDGR